MIDIGREVARVRDPVLAISGAGWAVLIAGPSAFHLHVQCPAMGAGLANERASISMLLAMNPPSGIAVAWAVMLVAMMAPLIIPAIHHVRFSSFARRRARSMALFVIGYAAVWMACGALLTGIRFAIAIVAPRSLLPPIAFGVLALVWQASPFKQRCLNACHDSRPIAVFGFKADIDALRFGLTHGMWCAAGCWALMLFPMLLPQGHLVGMAAVAMLMFCERLEDSAPPRWKMRGFAKASRIVVARTRLRLRMLRDGVQAFS